MQLDRQWGGLCRKLRLEQYRVRVLLTVGAVLGFLALRLNTTPQTGGNSCDTWVLTRTRRPFKIFIHPSKTDVFISSELRTRGEFETHLSEMLVHFASKNSKTVTIDVGANIGVHTLYLASFGLRVVAAEPLPANFNLLRCSVALNGFQDKVRVVPYAISDSRRRVTMQTSHDNSGNTFVPDRYSRGKGFLLDSFQTSIGLNHFMTITLLDLIPHLPQNGTPVVMKVDVERHECQLFKTFAPFVRVINVTHVFMEWLYDYQECRKDMVDTFISLGYRAKTMDRANIPNIVAWLASLTHDVNIYWEREQ